MPTNQCFAGPTNTEMQATTSAFKEDKVCEVDRQISSERNTMIQVHGKYAEEWWDEGFIKGNFLEEVVPELK